MGKSKERAELPRRGAGTLTFADNSKESTGPLVVNEGRLRFNALGLVAGTSSVTVKSGGQLDLGGAADFTFGGSALDALGC